METIYSEDHKLRDAQTELYGGQLVYPFERPSRLDYIHARLTEVGLGPITAPDTFGMEPILAVHDAAYVDFLQTAWDRWQAAGFKGEAIASTWPARRMVQARPSGIDGQLGYYALAAETSITQGTWQAALSSVHVALTGAERLRTGARGCFALCRPPGHHAAKDLYGGYCFFNNAAIAAQHLRDTGMARVAILDVDFHHGNGTQDIFYDRGDVLFVSLHGRPEEAFPHFLGYADETGAGEGEGATLNLPLPRGTGWFSYSEALDRGCRAIGEFGAEALVISFGADTYKDDPISFFALENEDFTRMGARLAACNLPSVILMEGGYAVSDLGVNTVNFLEGFDGRGL